MIAYRQQYDPHNHALRQLVTEGKLGALRGFVSSNSQQQGDPTQWRLKKSLSGGGCLPDVGLYCLNASRFLSGEEPTDVSAKIFQPKDDPRFTEVEASCSFSLKFPSGYVATCTTSYDVHKVSFFARGDKSVGLYVPRLCHAGLLLLQPKISVAPKTKTMINRIAQKKLAFIPSASGNQQCFIEVTLSR